jgi:hypothetical protein
VATTETGDITGTQDKDYNIIWFTEQCLSNALRLDQYIQDAQRAGERREQMRSDLVDDLRAAGALLSR